MKISKTHHVARGKRGQAVVKRNPVRICKPLTRRQLMMNTNPMCVVCKKRRGSDVYGGHICSEECENKYVACEEKYF